MESSGFSSLLPEEPTLETAGNDQKVLGKHPTANNAGMLNLDS